MDKLCYGNRSASILALFGSSQLEKRATSSCISSVTVYLMYFEFNGTLESLKLLGATGKIAFRKKACSVLGENGEINAGGSISSLQNSSASWSFGKPEYCFRETFLASVFGGAF